MTSRILLAVLLVCPMATAQVTVNGVIQPVPGPTVCMQGETHILDCTGVFLRSTLVNLNAFVGQDVRVTGADVGLLCHVIEVTSVAPATVVLSRAGAPTLGGTVTFTLCMYTSNPGDVYAFLVATTPGFFPIDPSLGTALLAPPIFVLGAGTQLTCASLPVAIPAIPSLVGASFWAQGFGGGTFFSQLSNAVCLTIG